MIVRVCAPLPSSSLLLRMRTTPAGVTVSSRRARFREASVCGGKSGTVCIEHVVHGVITNNMLDTRASCIKYDVKSAIAFFYF